MVGRITAVVFSTRFVRDHKKLDAVQRAAVAACIEDLYFDPIPETRRFHLLNPKRAGIYSVDLFSGKTTHKITLTIAGGIATFRRVDTHAAIDRSP
jgi:hypothetical protein